MNVNPGYETLANVLQRALDQAQDGKGAERHADSKTFDQQPMQTIAGQVGPGFLSGQAIKKIQESQQLPAGRDVAELLGAINYLAGLVIFLEMGRLSAKPANDNRPGCGRVGGCTLGNECFLQGECMGVQSRG